jgi:hypothetical protein
MEKGKEWEEGVKTMTLEGIGKGRGCARDSGWAWCAGNGAE